MDRDLPLSTTEDVWILIPGFLGYDEIAVTVPFTGKKIVLSDYYGSVRTMLNKHFVVNPSNVASMHDRSREVFAEVMGGVVDYGKEHAADEHHKRFGKFFEKGVHPEWSEDNPVVLLGHSYGAPTARYLHYCIANGQFEDRQGRKSNARWVKGIVSLSGVNRGATLPYIIGLEPGKKCTIRTLSVGRLMLSFVLLYEWFDIRWLNNLYGFQLNNKWPLSRRSAKTWKDALRLFWDALCGRSGWSDSLDNCMYDLSVEAANVWNTYCVCNPNAYYLNYISTDTWRSAVTGNYWPNQVFTKLFITAIQIGSRLFSPLVEKDILGAPSAHFWQSDGAVSVTSQFPCQRQKVAMRLVLRDQMEDPVFHTELLKRGIWHNIIVPDTDHMGLIGYGKTKSKFPPILNRIFLESYKFTVQFVELLFLAIVHCLWGKPATCGKPRVPEAHSNTETSDSESGGEGGDGTRLRHRRRSHPAEDVYGEHIRKEILAPLAHNADVDDMLVDPLKNFYDEKPIVAQKMNLKAGRPRDVDIESKRNTSRRSRREEREYREACTPLNERTSDKRAVKFLAKVQSKAPFFKKGPSMRNVPFSRKGPFLKKEESASSNNDSNPEPSIRRAIS